MRRLATTGVVAAMLFGAAPALAAPCDLNSYAGEINSATANQVITLPAGTCTGNITITNTAPFTLQGGAGGTTLEPTSLTSPIVSSSGAVSPTISGLTFTGADGAVALNLVDAAAVTLTGDKFTDDNSGPNSAGAVNITLTASTEPSTITDDVFSSDSGSVGGGLELSASGGQPLTISDDSFTGDSATNGGGGLLIYNFGTKSDEIAPVQVTGNTFGGSASGAGDTTEDQGGGASIYLATGQQLTLSGNKFIDNSIAGANTAEYSDDPREGAGLFLGTTGESYQVTQSDNAFTGNVISETETSPAPAKPVAAGGGGEWIAGLTVSSTADTYTDNRITVNDGNTPEGGGFGAIAAQGYAPTPDQPASFTGRDDYVAGNSVAVGGAGGGIYVGGPDLDCTSNCPGSSLTLDDSTVVDNSVAAGSGSEGGGIWGSPNDSLTVANSIVYGNTPAPNMWGFLPPSVQYSDACHEYGGADFTGSGDICENPLLNSNGTETSSSPTIGTGSVALVPAGLTTDLAGNARIEHRATCSAQSPLIVDMGAYQFPQFPLPCPAILPFRFLSSKLAEHHGATSVRVACGDLAACSGKLTITARHHRRRITLGSARIKLSAGREATIAAKLSAKALAKFGRARKLAVTLTASLKQGGTISLTLELTLPKPAKHKHKR
jgi:hypothetical protein